MIRLCFDEYKSTEALKKHEQLKTIKISDPNNITKNLRNHINGFSEDSMEIKEQFDFVRVFMPKIQVNELKLAPYWINRTKLTPVRHSKKPPLVELI